MIETVIWRVPMPVSGSEHDFKYSLALVANGICVMRYDNEAGKGDHKHFCEQEISYTFVDLPTLQQDFLADVQAWRVKQ